MPERQHSHSHSQHDFMGGKSCSSNLISFYDRVTHLVDQGQPVDVILLDFSLVVESVSHRIFLDKLSSTQLDEHIMLRVITNILYKLFFCKKHMSTCIVTLFIGETDVKQNFMESRLRK